MKTLDYSVLMSVYLKEHALFLRESIESMLSQTIMPKDFVLVCDGPLTEELDEVVSYYEKQYPEMFQIVRLPQNVGLGRALNEGMKHCRCELVARMDSDDISLPDRCEKQLAVFRGKDVDVASGSLVEFSGSEENVGKERKVPLQHDEIRRFARRRNPFNHPCVMYKKSSVLSVGGYMHFEGFEDYYLWVRMLQAGMHGCNLADVLLKMRVDDMHQRRGGRRYAGNMLRFRSYLLKTRFCNIIDFFVASAGHFAVSMMPRTLRKLFYEKVLR